MNFEAHLMLKDPETVYADWIRAGAERVIAHYEAFDSDEACSSFFQKFIEHFQADESLKVEVGLAVEFDTPIQKVLDHVLECDFIHLMSIREIGAQGRAFEEGIFDKIAELRNSYPETIISVDGGISVENAGRLVEAGVERLCVGSAIWQAEDPLEALEDLVLEAE
jgi:ribulose-phosphate 3-epimerase